MLSQDIWQRGETLLHETSRGVLAAATVAFILWLVAKWSPLRPALRRAVAGVAVIATLLTGFGVMLGRLVLHPSSHLDRLAAVAIILCVAALLAGRLRTNSARLALLGIASVVSGWWLGGAPMVMPNHATLLAIGLGGLAIAATVALSERTAGPWSTLAVGFVLWASLHLSGAPYQLAKAALIAFVAGFALFAQSGREPVGVWPYAGALAVVGITAVLGYGRLPRGGLSRIDLAAISPLLTLAIIAWLTRRGWRDHSAGVVASLVALLLIWTAGDLIR